MEAGDTRDDSGAPPKAMPTGDETIFVVEDDPEVRSFIVGALGSLGYTVLEAEDGPSALALLDEAETIDLLLTDVVLPAGMGGPDIAAAFRKRHPGGKVLYSSGYPQDLLSDRGRQDETVELMLKPYTRQALADRVRKALEA